MLFPDWEDVVNMSFHLLSLGSARSTSTIRYRKNASDMIAGMFRFPGKKVRIPLLFMLDQGLISLTVFTVMRMVMMMMVMMIIM